MILHTVSESIFSTPFEIETTVPPEASTVRLVYTTPQWPTQSDATVTFRFFICRDGVNWVEAWSDTSLIQRVPKSPDSLKVQLHWRNDFDDGSSNPQAFGAPIGWRVRIEPSAPMRTALSMEAY